MNGKNFAGASSMILALILAYGTAEPTRAQENKTPHPSMAPVQLYLMDRDAEIALARSAAPEAISHDATVLVLGRHGYETALAGKNGFVCVVERSWTSPFDSLEFWNPNIRGALCLNPPAVQSLLPITYKRTEMALAGLSKAQIMDQLKALYARKELPALVPGGMCFMMAKGAYLTDQGDHNLAHLMFYTPLMSGVNWGADLPNSPVMVGVPGSAAEPFTEFIVAVGKWSDGTAAPLM